MGTETELVGKEIFETGAPAAADTPKQPAAPVTPLAEGESHWPATGKDAKKEDIAKDNLFDNPPPPQKPGKPVKEKGPYYPGRNWLSILVLLFFISSASGFYIIFSGGIGGKKTVSAEPPSSPSFTRIATPKRVKDGVALIKVRGVITEPQGSASWGDPAGASTIAKRIREAADKDNIKAIILDVNSPGGTVAAVQDIYNAILYAREKKGKKVIALFRDVAASGGFYIAMACDKVIAQPGTLTGSIGVIMQTTNLEGLMGKVGVKFNAMKSGKHKDMGSAFRPMTEEEKTLFQELIDDSYAQFFEAVQKARPNINPVELKVYADGRVFTGRKAFSIGLIDGLGGEEEALKLAQDLTGNANLEIINIKTNTFREWFTSLEAEASNKNLTKQLEAAASPRVAYLWTM